MRAPAIAPSAQVLHSWRQPTTRRRQHRSTHVPVGCACRQSLAMEFPGPRLTSQLTPCWPPGRPADDFNRTNQSKLQHLVVLQVRTGATCDKGRCVFCCIDRVPYAHQIFNAHIAAQPCESPRRESGATNRRRCASRPCGLPISSESSISMAAMPSNPGPAIARSKQKAFKNCSLKAFALLLLVGVKGFEPSTPCTPCKCATRLRHTPKLAIIAAPTAANSVPGGQEFANFGEFATHHQQLA